MRMRMGENKNYRFVPFLPGTEQKMPKTKQKKLKNQTIPLWLNFEPKQVERGSEREKTKIIISFRSYLARNRKCQKKKQKNQKN